MTFAEINLLLCRVQYKDWEFHLSDAGGNMYLQVQFETRNCATGEPYRAHGRKWKLSPHMVKSEVVATCFKAALTAEEHEARECFKYDGRAIYNPHIDVDALHAVCQRVEVRDDAKAEKA